MNRSARADLLTGGGQAVLAQLRDAVLLRGAGVAGVGNDIDERRLIVLLGNGGVVHALGQQAALLHGLHGKTHCQADALAGDGALQEDRFPVQRVFAGDDDIGKILCLGVVGAFVGHSGNLGEDLFPNVGNQGRYSSHDALLVFYNTTVMMHSF